MSNNTVKQMIHQLGQDNWFEIYTENSLDRIVNGRDSYCDFDDYYDRKVQKVIIEFPNDEELQIIKLYIK